MAPLDRGAVFLAKMVSNLVFLLLVEVIAVPLFWLFFSSYATPADTAWLMVVPLLVGSIGIAGIGTLLSTITTRTRGKDVLLALIPLAVMSALFILVPSLTSSTSMMIIPSGALAIGLSYLRFRKER